MAANVTATGATITWTTNEPATSRVAYGPAAPNYGQATPLDGTLVANHSVTLSGLTPATLYHFMVESSDALGHGASSPDGTFTTASAPPAGPAAFRESSGQVVMEAEHFDQRTDRGGRSWTLETGRSGFSGTGYLGAKPNTGGSVSSGYVSASPEVSFNVNFSSTGTYYLWTRGSAQVANGNDDSAHAGLDGTGPSSADALNGFNTTSWVWKRDTMDGSPATLQIATPGVHTIHLWMREDGLLIDKLLLRKSTSSTAPSGTGPSESPHF
jgi:hypothetical protein